MIKHIVIALFVTLSLSAQSNSEWKKLNKSAHKIGFCLYSTNQEFCELHKSRQKELEKTYTSEDTEFFYVTMEEDWAKNRVTDFANKQSASKQSLVLFFDIDQGFETDYGDSRRAPFGFFIVNLKNDLEFKVISTYKKQAMRCAVFHESKPNILCNALWREFMTGRLGLLENRVDFLVYNKNNIKKKFKRFEKRFLKFQKKKLI